MRTMETSWFGGGTAAMTTRPAIPPEPARAEPLTLTAAPAAGHDAVLVVRVVGEVDLSTVGELRRHLSDQLTAPQRGVVLDITGVTFLAACGIGALVEADARARANGVALRLVCGDSRAVVRPLEATGLDETIPRADSVTEAVRLCAH